MCIYTCSMYMFICTYTDKSISTLHHLENFHYILRQNFGIHHVRLIIIIIVFIMQIFALFAQQQNVINIITLIKLLICVTCSSLKIQVFLFFFFGSIELMEFTCSFFLLTLRKYSVIFTIFVHSLRSMSNQLSNGVS